MTEPRRWNDISSEAPHELRAALRFARTHGPNEAQLEALTARLRVQLEAQHAPDNGAPALDRSGTRSEIQRWMRRLYLMSMLAVGLVVGVGLRTRGTQRAPEPASPPVLRADEAHAAEGPALIPLPEATMTLAPVPDVASEPAVPSPHPRVARRSERSAPRMNATTAMREGTSAGAASDEDELTLLFRARRLVSRDAVKALLLLREHEERFPRGSFQEERAALSIEALVRTGEHDEAARRYAEFKRKHPHSAYQSRLSGLLPGPGAAAPRAQ